MTEIPPSDGTKAVPIRSGETPEPRVFLSYSHTSPEHVERVVALAENLQGHGVHVVFDQWDLREGQDLHSFMEQAVNDPGVTRVLILCDPAYADKADERRAGVGTETLIISPGVYADVRQERIVPVIMARDDADTVRVPTYLNGRRYIDLSNPELEAAGYEELLRAIYNRPLRQRPPLGRPPEFLENDHVGLETAGATRLARAAILGDRRDAPGRLSDYLDRLLDVIAGQEITEVPAALEELSPRVIESIERLQAYRREFVGICEALARYTGDRLEMFDRLHRFFERLASIRIAHRQQRFLQEAETENISFFGWEMLLDLTALLLNESRFAAIPRIARPMYVASRHDDAGVLRSFDVLEPGFPILSDRNRGARIRWREPAAQLVKEHHEQGTPRFDSLMEADMLLWFRSVTDPETDGVWNPRTLVYAESLQRLPIFGRARSAGFFAQLAPALGVQSRAEFVARFRALPEGACVDIGGVISRKEAYARLLAIDSNE